MWTRVVVLREVRANCPIILLGFKVQASRCVLFFPPLVSPLFSSSAECARSCLGLPVAFGRRHGTLLLSISRDISSHSCFLACSRIASHCIATLRFFSFNATSLFERRRTQRIMLRHLGLVPCFFFDLHSRQRRARPYLRHLDVPLLRLFFYTTCLVPTCMNLSRSSLLPHIER
ncbi:hypothetical protein C8R45DRAFT_982654, partial [Mycena sanguinolenta]